MIKLRISNTQDIHEFNLMISFITNKRGESCKFQFKSLYFEAGYIKYWTVFRFELIALRVSKYIEV